MVAERFRLRINCGARFSHGERNTGMERAIALGKECRIAGTHESGDTFSDRVGGCEFCAVAWEARAGAGDLGVRCAGFGWTWDCRGVCDTKFRTSSRLVLAVSPRVAQLAVCDFCGGRLLCPIQTKMDDCMLCVCEFSSPFIGRRARFARA